MQIQTGPGTIYEFIYNDQGQTIGLIKASEPMPNAYEVCDQWNFGGVPRSPDGMYRVFEVVAFTGAPQSDYYMLGNPMLQPSRYSHLFVS